MKDIPVNITKNMPFRGEFGLIPISPLSPENINQLTGREKRVLESFSNVKRQKEFLSSRLLLKELAGALNISNFSTQKDQLGQPYGKADGQKYFVSIAHTNQVAFCGIADEPIGIDLEPLDRKVQPKLEDRIIHPNEKQLLADISLLQVWTIKEAYIKLRGQGLRMNMNEVQLQLKGDAFYAEINNDKSAKICSFQSEDNWLAIAYYRK